MRLWSIHPKYLDTKGLLAVWREALLAKKVLENKTKGYKHHPQLARFRECRNPLAAINSYLFWIYKEAKKRGYNFSAKKFRHCKGRGIIQVSEGQLEFERKHLAAKLKERDKESHLRLKSSKRACPHPIFKVVRGKVEGWEKGIRKRF
ncbi:MAG: pyrimidine dimer DNA glycosylase/endonuclease V [Candidatus Micrarchaeota archaeon]|nr:pyrimidine dimer DNA glycosylase/endonuclease V [Candidatus Micrarchaeota archaeon]